MSNDTITSLSTALADAVAAASASVLRVLHPRFPGTAVLWDDAGHVITEARRARSRDGRLRLELPDGSPAEATLLGRDPATDVSLWKLEAEALPAGLVVPDWADGADGPRVGELVLVLGRPGPGARATLGMVSQVAGAWRSPLGAPIDRFIDVDGSLPMGFAGGPLVAADGRFLGLNSRRVVHGGTTIPAATLRRVVSELAEHGAVHTAWLGVGVQGAALPEAVAAELGRERGVLLSAVEADSPAAKGGLLVGDILVSLDGEPLATLDDLVLALHGGRADAEVAIGLVRGGELRQVAVTLGRVESSVQERGGCGHRSHGHGGHGGHSHRHGRRGRGSRRG